jgi:hypothetical protein
MNFEEQLGPDYRFTNVDAENAHKAIGSYFVNNEPWTDTHEFAQLCIFAEDMHKQSGVWPTLSECITAWNGREDAYCSATSEWMHQDNEKTNLQRKTAPARSHVRKTK